MRPVVLRAAFAAVFLVCTLAGGLHQARAESLLQALFGFGSKPKPKPRSVRPPNFHQFPNGHRRGFRNPWARGAYQSRQSGLYRTVCVRTCDGYYFPISASTTRSKFHADAASCRARCGRNAKLYYMPKGSDDKDRMKDLSGRNYASLKMAYVYRKRLIAGCSCRPMPWSASERARHTRYQIDESIRAARLAAAQEREKRIAAGKLELEQSEADGETKVAALAEDGADQSSTAETDDGAIYVGAEQAPSPAFEQVRTTVAGLGVDGMPDIGANEPGSITAPSRSHMSRSRKAIRAKNGRKTSRKKKSKSQFGGFFASSPSKYRWPGD